MGVEPPLDVVQRRPQLREDGPYSEDVDNVAPIEVPGQTAEPILERGEDPRQFQRGDRLCSAAEGQLPRLRTCWDYTGRLRTEFF
jgi:hypothetical protein